MAESLYDYQREAVKWLVQQGRGFLWDAPGLGKTRQLCAAAKHLADREPILVVCPNSLKGWWKEEIQTLYPSAQVLVASRAGRFEHSASGRPLSRGGLPLYRIRERNLMPQWVICHYTGLRLSCEQYAAVRWGSVVLDECHYIKNRSAARTKAVMNATPPSAHRLGATATPFSRNPADVWSQLHWMYPGSKALRSYWNFFELFVDYTLEQNQYTGRSYRQVHGGKNLEELARLLAIFGLRRSKAEVAAQLPPITDTHLPLICNGRQREVYEALADRTEVEFAIRDTSGSDELTPVIIPNILARMVKLERWLSHPWVFDPGVKGAKFEWLEEWVAGYDEQAVIVTRFKHSAEHIARHLECRAVTGNIPQKLRGPVIKEWQKGAQQFLVGTINVLGTGLNLDAAHTLVCYDQMSDAILMEQVRERIHRVTTTHPTQVIYLYCADTINEVTLHSFLNKWNTIQQVRAFLEMLRKRKEGDR